MTEPAPVIAIDGTAGAGKGTLAQRLAQDLGWNYLDSGALYRANALAVLQSHTDPKDAQACAAIIQTMDLVIQFSPHGLHIQLNGTDVSHRIRTPEVGTTASIIAAHPEIRQALMPLQRRARQAPGLVADGRDMTSVVFPDAILKVFLTASLHARAERRQAQLKEIGVNAKIATLIQELTLRDQQDAQRGDSPLVQTPDAFFVDTSEYSIEQVCAIVRARLPDLLTQPDKGKHS